MTPIAGTTRDIVELQVSIGGYPVIIADTAGLRTDASDEVEKEGISRAHAYAQQADLVIVVIDATKYEAQMTRKNSVSFDTYVNSYITKLKLDSVIRKIKCSGSTSSRTGQTDLKCDGSTDNILGKICGSEKCIIVLNKTDLLHDVTGMKYILKQYNAVIALSCKTEDGIPQLLDKMTSNLTVL